MCLGLWIECGGGQEGWKLGSVSMQQCGWSVYGCVCNGGGHMLNDLFIRISKQHRSLVVCWPSMGSMRDIYISPLIHRSRFFSIISLWDPFGGVASWNLLLKEQCGWSDEGTVQNYNLQYRYFSLSDRSWYRTEQPWNTSLCRKDCNAHEVCVPEIKSWH